MSQNTTSDIAFKAINGQFNIDQAEGIVECFVAAIGNKDSVGDVVATGAFTESLKRRKPRVVWGHSWNDPIGKVLEIYEVPASDPRLPAKMKQAGVGGLYARVQFNLATEKGREAFASVAFFGQDQEWSIGYKTIQAAFDPNLQANILREVELYEVSPVLHGANQLTATLSVKSDEMEKWHQPGMMIPGFGPQEQPKLVVVRLEEDDDNGEGNRDLFAEGEAQELSPEQTNALEMELMSRSGSPIKLISATENSAIFARVSETGKQIYRIAYHREDDDGEYMFGKPERIRGAAESRVTGPTVIPSQMPGMPMMVKPSMPQQPTQMIMQKIGSDEAAASLNNLWSDDDSTDEKLNKVLGFLQGLVGSSEKSDVPEEPEVFSLFLKEEQIFEAKQLLDPVLDYHRLEYEIDNNGIHVVSPLSDESRDALRTARKSIYSHFGRGSLGKAEGASEQSGAPDTQEVKALGGKLGSRIGGGLRSAGPGMSFVDITGTFDADVDGIVFEGKPGLERPIIPRFVVPKELARKLSKLTIGDALNIEKQRRAGNTNIQFDENRLRSLIADLGEDESLLSRINSGNRSTSIRAERAAKPLSEAERDTMQRLRERLLDRDGRVLNVSARRRAYEEYRKRWRETRAERERRNPMEAYSDDYGMDFADWDKQYRDDLRRLRALERRSGERTPVEKPNSDTTQRVQAAAAGPSERAQKRINDPKNWKATFSFGGSKATWTYIGPWDDRDGLRPFNPPMSVYSDRSKYPRQPEVVDTSFIDRLPRDTNRRGMRSTSARNMQQLSDSDLIDHYEQIKPYDPGRGQIGMDPTIEIRKEQERLELINEMAKRGIEPRGGFTSMDKLSLAIKNFSDGMPSAKNPWIGSIRAEQVVPTYRPLRGRDRGLRSSTSLIEPEEFDALAGDIISIAEKKQKQMLTMKRPISPDDWAKTRELDDSYVQKISDLHDLIGSEGLSNEIARLRSGLDALSPTEKYQAEQKIKFLNDNLRPWFRSMDDKKRRAERLKQAAQAAAMPSADGVIAKTFNEYIDHPPVSGLRSRSGLTRPQFPRKPTQGAFIGEAEDIFDGVESWDDFKRIYDGEEVIFLDYETTGLKFDEFGESSGNGLPTQIGAVRVKNGQVVDRFNIYINPGIPMSEWEQWSRDNLKDDKGNPITDAFLEDRPSIAEAHRQLLEFIGEARLLGMQNAVFDNEVLEDALASSGIDWRPGGIIDTKEISAMVLPKYSKDNPDGPFLVNKAGVKIASSGLGPVTQYLGVDLGDKHHTADADAEATAKVLQATIDKAIEKEWPSTVFDRSAREQTVQDNAAKYARSVESFRARKDEYIAAEERARLVEEARVADFNDAIQKTKSFSMMYQKAGEPDATKRIVTPLEILTETDNGQAYVRAFDHDRGEERTFRLDRIVSYEETDKPAEQLPGGMRSSSRARAERRAVDELLSTPQPEGPLPQERIRINFENPDNEYDNIQEWIGSGDLVLQIESGDDGSFIGRVSRQIDGDDELNVVSEDIFPSESEARRFLNREHISRARQQGLRSSASTRRMLDEFEASAPGEAPVVDERRRINFDEPDDETDTVREWLGSADSILQIENNDDGSFTARLMQETDGGSGEPQVISEDVFETEAEAKRFLNRQYGSIGRARGLRSSTSVVPRGESERGDVVSDIGSMVDSLNNQRDEIFNRIAGGENISDDDLEDELLRLFTEREGFGPRIQTSLMNNLVSELGQDEAEQFVDDWVAESVRRSAAIRKSAEIRPKRPGVASGLQDYPFSKPWETEARRKQNIELMGTDTFEAPNVLDLTSFDADSRAMTVDENALDAIDSYFDELVEWVSSSPGEDHVTAFEGALDGYDSIIEALEADADISSSPEQRAMLAEIKARIQDIRRGQDGTRGDSWRDRMIQESITARRQETRRRNLAEAYNRGMRSTTAPSRGPRVRRPQTFEEDASASELFALQDAADSKFLDELATFMTDREIQEYFESGTVPLGKDDRLDEAFGRRQRLLDSRDEQIAAGLRSSSRSGNNKKRRMRQKWTDEERRAFAEQRLRSKKIPKKRREGPTAGEWGLRSSNRSRFMAGETPNTGLPAADKYVAARRSSAMNPRSGMRSSTGPRSGRTEINSEATFFKQILDSIPREVSEARKAGDQRTAAALGELANIMRRQKSAEVGPKRTNAGSIFLTQDEVDSTIDALMFVLDRQRESDGSRTKLFSDLIELVSRSAMSTFIDKTTPEINDRFVMRPNKDGQMVKIPISR